MAAPATATPAIEPPDADASAPYVGHGIGHSETNSWDPMIVVTFAFSILSFVSPNEIRVQSHLILVPRAYGGRKRRAPMVPKLRQSKERVSRSRKKQKK